MKRFTLILSGVLAFQIALAFLLSLTGSDYAAFKAEQPLLAFDKDKVDQIDIDESGANSVALKKEAGKWVIPGMAGFPANQDQVTGLIGKLAGLKKGWPVATTSDAATRFKVSEKSHERRIVLKSGDKQMAELLIGTAPTYREVHARTGGDDAVYSIAMAAYDAGTRGEEWMNRDYLEVPQDKIASISVGDVVLNRKDGKFVLDGLKPEDKPNDMAIAELAGVVAHPSFDVVQGKGKDALAKLDPADIQVTVKPTQGDSVTYKYKKEAAGGAYLFASSAHDYVFRVAEATISPIVKAKREILIEAKAESKDQKKDEAKEQAKDLSKDQKAEEAKASDKQQKPEEVKAPDTEQKPAEANAPDKDQKPAEANAPDKDQKPEAANAQEKDKKHEEAKDQNKDKPINGSGG